MLMVTVRAARWHACGPEHSRLCMGIVEALKKCCIDGFGQMSFTQGTVNSSRNCSLPALFLLSRAGLPHGVSWDQLSSLPWDLLVFYLGSLVSSWHLWELLSQKCGGMCCSVDGWCDGSCCACSRLHSWWLPCSAWAGGGPAHLNSVQGFGGLSSHKVMHRLISSPDFVQWISLIRKPVCKASKSAIAER